MELIKQNKVESVSMLGHKSKTKSEKLPVANTDTAG